MRSCTGRMILISTLFACATDRPGMPRAAAVWTTFVVAAVAGWLSPSCGRVCAAADAHDGGPSPSTNAAGDSTCVADAEGTFPLSNGLAFPAVSFGSAGLGRRTEVVIGMALAEGFRAIDTAQAWEWCVTHHQPRRPPNSRVCISRCLGHAMPARRRLNDSPQLV